MACMDFVAYLSRELKKDDRLLGAYVNETNAPLDPSSIESLKGFIGWVAQQYDPDLDWEKCFDFENFKLG